MGRPLLIVGIVALMMAGGVAMAASTGEVRMPVTMQTGHDEPVPQQTTVVPGDHLWKISAHHLSRYAPDREVAPYWLEVIEMNRADLRSGDPDLIFPGEVIRLPVINELR